VAYLNDHRTTLADFLALAPYRPKSKSKRPSLPFAVDTQSRAILRQLQAQKLRPITTQRCVACKDGRTGTAIDIVCVHSTRKNEIHLVEVKTGYTNYLKHTKTNMSKPFDHLRDSLYWQHQLQLLATTEMFIMTHKELWKKYTVKACVMRARGIRVDVYPLEASLCSRRDDMWKWLTNGGGGCCNEKKADGEAAAGADKIKKCGVCFHCLGSTAIKS
jgi:hypothetical protein